MHALMHTRALAPAHALASARARVAPICIIPVTKSLYSSSSDSTIDMKTKELIQKEIEVIPEPYLEEVLDFIHSLKEKASKKGMETAILSESVLSKDWLSPEEDEAWKDL